MRSLIARVLPGLRAPIPGSVWGPSFRQNRSARLLPATVRASKDNGYLLAWSCEFR